MTQRILIAVILIYARANTSQAAPFTNGDFTQGVGTAGEWEDYTPSWWTLNPGAGTLVSQWVYNGGTAKTYYYARFEGEFGGEIAQTFDTTIGQTYAVTFQMLYWSESYAETFKVTAPGLVKNTTHDEGSTDLRDTWGGTTSYRAGYQFTATKTSSTLAFERINAGSVAPYGSANKADWVGLTNVGVTAVPEPASSALLALSVVALLRRRRSYGFS